VSVRSELEHVRARLRLRHSRPAQGPEPDRWDLLGCLKGDQLEEQDVFCRKECRENLGLLDSPSIGPNSGIESQGCTPVLYSS
jgi:hypothetical protein